MSAIIRSESSLTDDGKPEMSKRTEQAQAQAVLTPEQVKTRLHEQGTTLKEWAKKHGYPYQTVSHVVRGINRGNYGLGYRIAVALGMKQ